jgi:hypothetical protein
MAPAEIRIPIPKAMKNSIPKITWYHALVTDF